MRSSLDSSKAIATFFASPLGAPSYPDLSALVKEATDGFFDATASGDHDLAARFGFAALVISQWLAGFLSRDELPRVVLGMTRGS